MYRIIRGFNDSVETLKDSIDRREKIFMQSNDAEQAADKLNSILLEGELTWRVEKCVS
ncbi:hypothetical protein [Thalassobacillus hwangdonensis]|uniref:Uncharacterized protein n=1 Tax=Thalassobacillus hwangdonensis TaxID=546108 RepID=A0ABW3L7Q0_9BACI